MVIIHNPLFWVLVGGITALLLMKSMEWSVDTIHPDSRSASQKGWKSIALIISGTLMRWVLISLVLAYALSHTILAGLIVFGTFLIIRFIFLLKWQGWLRSIH